MNSWPALDRFLQTDPRDAGWTRRWNCCTSTRKSRSPIPADESNGTRRWPPSAGLRPCAEDLKGCRGHQDRPRETITATVRRRPQPGMAGLIPRPAGRRRRQRRRPAPWRRTGLPSPAASAGFRPLRVAKVVPETATVSSIYLTAPDGSPSRAARAGQYLTLRIPSCRPARPGTRLSLLVVPNARRTGGVVDKTSRLSQFPARAAGSRRVQQQDPLAGRRRLVGERATASARTDDDDVVVLGSYSLHSWFRRGDRAIHR